MKIVIVGLGYVGLSNAVLLAQHNEVVGVDICEQRVDALNARSSPIIDEKLSEYLIKKKLNLSASTDLESSVKKAQYVIVSTPTNYDEKTNCFDTSSVETVLSKIIVSEPSTCIIIKSTVPVGFTENVRTSCFSFCFCNSSSFFWSTSFDFVSIYLSRSRKLSMTN